MRTQCPACRTYYKVDEAKSGKTLNCPKCNCEFTISAVLDDTPSKAANAKPGIRTEAANEPSTNLNDLQEAADYIILRKELKWPAIGDIVFGMLAIVAGIQSRHDHPLNALLAFMGILLFAHGLWLISSPSPISYVTNGIALMIVGIWNILVTILALRTLAQQPSFQTNIDSGAFWWGFLGGMQILWAFHSFARYSPFLRKVNEDPSVDTIERVHKTIREIKESKPSEGSELVSFDTAGLWGKAAWKGKLKGEDAIFVDTKRGHLVSGDRERILFKKIRKSLVGGSYQFYFCVGENRLRGSIPIEDFEKYERWKAATH